MREPGFKSRRFFRNYSYKSIATKLRLPDGVFWDTLKTSTGVLTLPLENL